jgi:hypothetical protein
MRPGLLPVVLLALLASTCDIFNPHATTRFDMGASALDVFVRNDTLLVAAGDSGLLAFDISKPKAPRELWRAVLGRDSRCVIAAGGYAFVGTDSGVLAYRLVSGDRTWLQCGGSNQFVAGLAADSTRLYAASGDGVTVFNLPSMAPVRYAPLAGDPTGLARRDTRLFVSLRDWGVRVFNVVSADSLALDTLQLGRHNRAEGVTMSVGGHCIISQADSGLQVVYSPTPDTVRVDAAGGFPNYGVAATDGVQEVSIYAADSSTVMIHKLIKKPEMSSFSTTMDFAEFTGFTRRICLGGNGYVYTASGDAGVYIIRE